MALLKNPNSLSVLSLVWLVPAVVFKSLPNHRDDQDKDKWIDSSNRRNRRNEADAAQNNDKQKVAVGEAEELVSDSEWQERDGCVLGGANVVTPELFAKVWKRIVQQNCPHVCAVFVGWRLGWQRLHFNVSVCYVFHCCRIQSRTIVVVSELLQLWLWFYFPFFNAPDLPGVQLKTFLRFELNFLAFS